MPSLRRTQGPRPDVGARHQGNATNVKRERERVLYTSMIHPTRLAASFGGLTQERRRHAVCPPATRAVRIPGVSVGVRRRPARPPARAPSAHAVACLQPRRPPQAAISRRPMTRTVLRQKVGLDVHNFDMCRALHVPFFQYYDVQPTCSVNNFLTV